MSQCLEYEQNVNNIIEMSAHARNAIFYNLFREEGINHLLPKERPESLHIFDILGNYKRRPTSRNKICLEH